MIAALVIGATCLARLTASGQGGAVKSWAFVDATIYTMTAEQPVQHQTVVVQDGRITAVGPVNSTKVPAGATSIASSGKFLTPGLIDGHVHLLEQADLGQYLAFGVTTVRNMMGTPKDLEWRAATASGTLKGPRIFTAGPVFAGPDVRWLAKVVPRGAEMARSLVKAQHDSGYDFIKIYDGISREAYEAIVSEARALGMRIDGHIPADVGLGGVLMARQDLQHTDKILFTMWGHQFDTTRIDSVVRAVKNAGVYVTPTIAGMEMMGLIGAGKYDSLLARPELSRIGGEFLDFFCTVVSTLKGSRPPVAGVRYNPWADFQLRIISAERRLGVPIIAGTDLPNGMLAPGSSLMEEMRALGDAGLTPYEALTAATKTAAAAIGDTSSGIIAPGARADLVLLSADPLAGYGRAYLTGIDGVMANGRWLPRIELDRFAPPRASAPECPK